ncbi:hypothetical protein [Streptomyces sp. B29(2018)]|uniref:hypothetical protein n=1 Tax=Streptomyces sp. B29(2018) TaxID=2485016 RepID=UPI000FD6757F|nr:hypothetical protein [Streptomyces sp. B29(2018)]
MPTFLAADPPAPAPNALQRTWLLAALRAADGLLPAGVSTRSLNVLRERGWITTAPARDDDAEFVRYKITPAGRIALLSGAKADALLSTLVAVEPGRIEAPVQERILNSLVREGLVVHLTRRGKQDEDQEQYPYITNLGRRLVGLTEVDSTPSDTYLIDAFAQHGIRVCVETDEDGNTQIAYREKGVEALFYRPIDSPGRSMHSATHPAWMHASPWYGFLDHRGDYLEMHLPNNPNLKEGSARMAASFAAWLSSRDDAAFSA